MGHPCVPRVWACSLVASIRERCWLLVLAVLLPLQCDNPNRHSHRQTETDYRIYRRRCRPCHRQLVPFRPHRPQYHRRCRPSPSCRRSRAASHPHPHSPATSWERRSRGTRSVLRGRATARAEERRGHCLVLPQPQPVIALHCLICCTVCLFRDDLPTPRAPYTRNSAILSIFLENFNGPGAGHADRSGGEAQAMCDVATIYTEDNDGNRVAFAPHERTQPCLLTLSTEHARVRRTKRQAPDQRARGRWHTCPNVHAAELSAPSAAGGRRSILEAHRSPVAAPRSIPEAAAAAATAAAVATAAAAAAAAAALRCPAATSGSQAARAHRAVRARRAAP